MAIVTPTIAAVAAPSATVITAIALLALRWLTIASLRWRGRAITIALTLLRDLPNLSRLDILRLIRGGLKLLLLRLIALLGNGKLLGRPIASVLICGLGCHLIRLRCP